MKYPFASVFSSSPLLSYLTSIILRYCRHRVAVSASLPLLLIIGSTSDCVAQSFGNGPAVSNFQPSTFNGASFGLDSGVNCPTPSFTVVGFTGSSSDYARSRSTDAIGSSNSGLDNYGVAAGFTVPLGGRYAKFCKDFAETRTLDLRKRAEITRARYQAQLTEQCVFLAAQLKVDFSKKYYDEDGGGAVFFPCRAIIGTINIPKGEDNKPKVEKLPSIDPKKVPSFSEPEPITPRPIPSIPVN